ncbi:hypothetical protein PR048_029245 [Dryococelus australis]|uniref:Uncharacterized protein n=1 Tax=Dryococelus australis TaxID=614101 RepID=A0ABQ9GD77_9NEOP|nr:hypothetical protein PR048_029245 [Dryococelus australis]
MLSTDQTFQFINLCFLVLAGFPPGYPSMYVLGGQQPPGLIVSGQQPLSQPQQFSPGPAQFHQYHSGGVQPGCWLYSPEPTLILVCDSAKV